jgi:hypothetical protein
MMLRQRIVALLILAMFSGPVTFLQANDEGASDLIEVPITPAERQHWAYLPVKQVTPPDVNDPAWCENSIDRFIKDGLESQGIESLPPAGKLTMLRRVTFDLTGLPPTPQEIAEFLADDRPDAYARLVDRLLASKSYGERYAQHWLDLARFAETDGFEHDLLRPNAWRYRDWVIDALNRDVPYDEFIRLQLAGDELDPEDPQAAIATGFLLCGPDMPDLNLQEERRHVVLNEMTATVGSALLAMQFGCAQCHDHKYDPIRIQDFYRLRAFFESAQIFRDHPVPSPDEIAARKAAESARDPKYAKAAARKSQLETLGRQRFRDENPDERPSLKQVFAKLTESERQEYDEAAKLAASAPPLPELPLGRVMRPGPTRQAFVYLRGDFRRQGPVAECSFPGVLDDSENKFVAPLERPRTALAGWLTRPDHPLVARVIVNRLWQWHFGRGLVDTPSDFGTMGSEPTHPELLDWLAKCLIEDGWSLKSMHRRMVTSRAYQLASVPYDAQWSEQEIATARDAFERAHTADPENVWCWRRLPQRLSGEAIRDAMLVVSDKLSPRAGGPGIRPPLAPEISSTLLANQWRVNGDEEDHRRRSIYLFVRRNLRYPLFDVFDRPDTNASCAMRHESTTATQSLTQFNSEFSLQRARWLAGAILAGSPGGLTEADHQRLIEAAYLRVFNRPPDEEEQAAGKAFLASQRKRLSDEGRQAAELALPEGSAAVYDPYAGAALVDFCLALFNANAFLYVE